MSVQIRVYDSRIYAWNVPGGMIYQWVKRMGMEMEVIAKSYCPKRTGRLASSIYSKPTSNQHAVYLDVGANARDTRGTSYALFVHDGTHGAVAQPDYPMKWWGWGPWSGKFYQKTMVRGQEANPFLARAARTVLTRHGIG